MLNPFIQRIAHIHFVGIGGAGMAGIAEVLLNQGYRISGSDLSANALTNRLQGLGAQIFQGHHSDHMIQADVLVLSSAIPSDNPEVAAAHAARIPVISRAEMLAELMRFQQGIAVVGTHGKTTVTSLIAHILGEAKLDPTFVIGGRINHIGHHGQLGTGAFFVAEADESDASFLQLQPIMAVITNINEDHLSTYNHSLDQLEASFLTFVHRLPFYGLAVVCQDDPALQRLIPKMARPLLTYGFSEAADIQVTHYQQDGLRSHAIVKRNWSDQHKALEITLNIPGKHNMLNALAAIGIATECGAQDKAILQALAEFPGVARRFQVTPHITLQGKEVTLIDDYGHHPKELAATIETARSLYPNQRLVMIFQPHRYSRTQALFEDFVDILSTVDVLALLDIYAAGETPIPGIDSRTLCGSIRHRGQIEPTFIHQLENCFELLAPQIKPGDVLLLQGAGSITQLIDIAQQQQHAD